MPDLLYGAGIDLEGADAGGVAVGAFSQVIAHVPDSSVVGRVNGDLGVEALASSRALVSASTTESSKGRAFIPATSVAN